MKNAVASKPRSKKNSDDDEDRSEKKRKKIKSRKRRSRRRRRRRGDSSLSSFSSDSDDGPRARRKRAKKLEKRKKESKNPDKKSKKRKKLSRKARHRGVSSSSSYSSRGCSTCRSRSRSPGRSVSKSPSRKGRSKRRSRVDGVEQRGRNRQRRTVSYGLEDGKYRSRSCSSCGRSASRSPSSRSTSRGGDKYEEIGKVRSTRLALAVAAELQALQVRTDGKGEQRDRIIHAYDDFDRYDSRRDSDSYREAPERNFLQEATKGASSTHHGDGEVGFNQTDESMLGNADVDDGHYNWTKSLGGSEPVDLETQLRIKALENLKKFRRSLSANTRSDSNQENDSTVTLSHRDTVSATTPQGIVKSLDGKLTSPFEKQEILYKELWHAKPRLRSVINIPAERDTSSCVISHQISSESYRKLDITAPDNSIGDSDNPQLLKRTEESSGKTFLQASMKEKQERQSAVETGRIIAGDSAVNQGDGQPSSGLSTHHELDSGKGNEEDNAGSQFQQKTFSRMHDGELVQVSYKVYIPKKRPALERRQLQR